ncbi:MAG: DNA/RNA non-specific endonuclease [Bacteroidales bacterium]|nr:DNA/RNA non-specific endonuclease [Bacteroidales bacterium]
MTTAGTSNIEQTGATLSASFSGVSGGTIHDAYFEYGTSSSSLTEKAYYGDAYALKGLASGRFSVPVTGLSSGTTYYYRAVMQVGEKDFYGSVKSFTTQSAPVVTNVPQWLEMPAQTSASNCVYESLGRGTSRNYSYLYDKSMYAERWCAYPLTASHTSGSASTGAWSFNPNIPGSAQIDVRSSSYPTAYGATGYSRGHIIPNADRKSSSAMNAQTYYLTNQVPQLQDKFNNSVWGSLENGVRSLTLTSSADTVYVVSGVCFQKQGASETVDYLTSSTVTPSRIPVANYFYKVLLKVRRSGSTITAASAIGFWFEHRNYTSGDSYTNYSVSVDQIESWTGFDFFVNLPDSVESSAETNTSWSSFQSFH